MPRKQALIQPIAISPRSAINGDFNLSDGWEFVDPSGIVRRDNFRDKSAPAGSAIGLSSELGLSTLQLPSLRTTFWFDPVNAIQLQGRYFVNYGAAGMHRTLYFNGDTIPPNQLLSSGASAGSPSTCISAGSRRCTSDTMICCRPCCADGTPAPASGLNSSISTSASATAIRA